MRNLNAGSAGVIRVVLETNLHEVRMFGMRKIDNNLCCDHQAPTPVPIEDPELPERLPEPMDEPPVPNHNPSIALVRVGITYSFDLILTSLAPVLWHSRSEI